MSRIPAWVWILGGMAALVAFGSAGVIAVDYISASWLSSANAKKWLPFLTAAENNFGIPAGLLARIAYQESRFRQDVIAGTTTSEVGALGLMQLLPQYFQTVRRPIPFSDSDTQDQINEAASLLSSLYHRFGDWTLAVAAYNDGAGNINQVLAGTRSLPAQTAQYLQQISADLPALIAPSLNT
jgi:soluble lytic murein transglycosylase-like protein